MLKKGCVIFLNVLIILITLNAQKPPGARFLDINIGARSGAMGNAFTSVADDTTSLYWNPSGIMEITKKQFGITYHFLYADISYSFIGYIQPVKNIGNFGAGLFLLSSGEIPITKEDTSNSEKILSGNFGSFSFSDSAFYLSYARIIKFIPVGVTVKFIQEKLYNISASGMGIDIGMKYILQKLPEIKGSFCVQNLGFIKTSGNVSYPLPLNFNFGVSLKYLKNSLLALDVKYSYYYKISFKFGIEYQYTVNNRIILYPRAGYKTSERVGKYVSNEDLTVDSLNGFTFGAGIFYKMKKFDLNFDYVIIPHSDLGNMHKISVNTKF